MKIHRPGRELELGAHETTVLTMLLDELRPIVGDESSGDDPVHQRLYPSAYPDDADAEAEYRSITGSTLRSERLDRIDACAGELAAGQPILLADPDVARRWLQVLNDLRLALGTRLGVAEEPPDVDPTDPDAQSWMLYGWLTALQDDMVHAAMR